MRNTILHKTDGVLWGLIRGVLVLTLFTMMSLPAWAHDQQKQDSHSSTIASLPNINSNISTLEWLQLQQEVRVTTHLSGLQPNSNHAAYIRAGTTCSAMGKVMHPLKNIVADSAGNATTTDIINNMPGGIPATGWLVVVHHGSTGQTSPLMCGNVANPKKTTTVSVPLGNM